MRSKFVYNRLVNHKTGMTPFMSLQKQVCDQITRHDVRYQSQAKKSIEECMIYKVSDLVWIHLQKTDFLGGCCGKLNPNIDGPLCVPQHINDNALNFRVVDLSPYKASSDEDMDLDIWM
ncbi:hypothetical protein LXL04_004243 [Taraxacum kok-saghyz]